MTGTYDGLRVELGATPVDVFADARNLHVRRGLSPAGLSDNLDPGTLTLELEGAAYNPQTNPLTRPGGPVSIVLDTTTAAPPPDPGPAGPDPALVGTTVAGLPSWVEVTEVPYTSQPDNTASYHMHRFRAHFAWIDWPKIDASNAWSFIAYQIDPVTLVATSIGSTASLKPPRTQWVQNLADGSWTYDSGAVGLNFSAMGTHRIDGVSLYVGNHFGAGYNWPGNVSGANPRPCFWFGPKILTRTDGRDIPQGPNGVPAPPPEPPPPVVAARRVFTGTITRARLGFSARDSVDEIVVYLEATDAITALSTAPHATAIGGSYAQRIHHVTDPLGVATVVHDTETNKATPVLPSNETTALGNLRLVRDTNHGIVFVDKTNTLQAYADRDRPVTDVTVTFTDVRTPGAVHYTALEPVFDTAELVNVVTVESLTGDGAAVSGTYSDADSLATWGPGPGSVTVNEGQPDAHAYRYLNARADPTLTAERVVFNATEDPTVAADLELYQTARVIRTGLLDETTQVLALEHHITHRRWTVAVTCRPAEGLPTRWVDLPPALTWAQVDPALSWFDVVTWTP